MMRKPLLQRVAGTVAMAAVMLSTTPAPARAMAPRVTPAEQAWCRFWADYLTFSWFRESAYNRCIAAAAED